MTRTCAIIITACGLAASGAALAQPASAPATAPAETLLNRIGKIEHPAISESSGIVASRRHQGVFWTHNDGGNAPVLYAIDQTGRLIGEFPVAAENIDWEDIAIDDAGNLYIADIGNNLADRNQVLVHRVAEPNPRARLLPGFTRTPLRVAATWWLNYPEAPFDAEALFVHEGFGYIISKLRSGRAASLYRFSLAATAEPQVLQRVAAVPIRSPVTAGDISADGRTLAVLSVTGLSLFRIEGDPLSVERAASIFLPHIHAMQEGCCFMPEGVLVTNEHRDVLLFRTRDLAFSAHQPTERPQDR